MEETKIIPTEVKSEIKLYKFLYIKDFIFLVVVLMVTSNFSKAVHPALQLPYLIYCLAWSFILILPANNKTNPKRKIYELIAIIFTKSKHTYKPIKEYLISKE